MEEVNACTDSPSVMDYTVEGMFGDTGSTFEAEKSFPKIPFKDQSLHADTRMACTRYAMAHAVESVNMLVSEVSGSASYVTVDARKLWLDYVAAVPTALTNGATLRSALDQYRADGLISWYVSVSTVEQIKASISANRPVFTGSNVGDWAYVTSNGEYRVRTDGRLVGHAIVIVGYTSTHFIAMNSYGEDNGYFLIPFALTDTLFTRYSVIDASDEGLITKYKEKIMNEINIEEARKAFVEGIWNGERATQTVTREEAAAMIQRAIDKLTAK